MHYADYTSRTKDMLFKSGTCKLQESKKLSHQHNSQSLSVLQSHVGFVSLIINALVLANNNSCCNLVHLKFFECSNTLLQVLVR